MVVIENHKLDENIEEGEKEFKKLSRFGRIAFKYVTFFSGWGSDFGSKFLLSVFWIIMILEVPLYVVNAFYFMKWFIGFRDCWAFTATWVHLIGLGFGCGWVPYAILLADWEKNLRITRKCAYMFYLVGVFITTALAPFSLWMISKYWMNPGFLKDEWLTSTKGSLQNGHFPQWLTDLGWPSFFKFVDCCAWHGPLDLGMTFDFSVLGGGKKLTMERMDEISTCYNDLFSTTMKESLLSFELKTEMSALPPGCGQAIMKDLKELCYFIFVSCIIQLVLTILFFLGYSYYPVCFIKEIKRSSIATAFRLTNERKSIKTYPSDSDSLNDIKGPKTSANDNNNISPRSISPSAIVFNKRNRLGRKHSLN